MDDSNQTQDSTGISVDSQYIQQHFANERTFLAWIRTCITIMGVGFLITNLHFTSRTNVVPVSDVLAKVIGLVSIGVGIVALCLSTISYFKKSRDINRQTFHYSKVLIWFLSISLLVIFLIFSLYFWYAWRFL